MSLSERMSQRGRCRAAQAPPGTRVDGLSGFKVLISNAFFERLGQRLFETQNEEQLQATVVAEIERIMAAEEAPLTADERARLVQEIARDVMGYGPTEPFLADPDVTEVMVNGTEHIYVERGGVIEATIARFISEAHLRRVIDRIVSQSAGGSMRPVHGGRPPP